MIGVIYARYSEGPRQTDQSIEGQVDDCKAFAQQKDIKIIEVYADRHISGKSVAGRDEFQRMMRDADQHKFDCIIVWKIDRFGRNREDIAVNKIRLRKAGVTLMYAKEAVPEGPEGILLESLLEGLAEYYSADLRQKVVRGLDESAKKGKWPTGSLPIGYRKDSDQHIVLDEDKAPVIREVFQQFISGASQKDLQKYLFEHGIADKNNHVPVQAVVYRMLRNERYTGKFVYHGIDVPAPAIIDQGTFDTAQKCFKGTKMNAAGTAKTNYLLSCKCHCGYCGKLLSGETGTSKTGRIYHYYTCGRKKHEQKCELKAIPQDKLEDLVIDHTISDVLQDDLIDQLTAKVMEIQQKRQEDDLATALKERLKDNRKRQERIVTAIESGGSRALSSRLADLEAEEDDLTVQIQRAELRHPIIPAEVIKGWLMSFRSGDKDDPAFRKRLVQTFVADVIVTNDLVTIYYNTEKEPHTNLKSSCTTRWLDFVKWCTNSNAGSASYQSSYKYRFSDGYIILQIMLSDVVMQEDGHHGAAFIGGHGR